MFTIDKVFSLCSDLYCHKSLLKAYFGPEEDENLSEHLEFGSSRNISLYLFMELWVPATHVFFGLMFRPHYYMEPPTLSSGEEVTLRSWTV